MTLTRRLAFLLVILAGISTALPAQTIFVVRHAEKTQEKTNAQLNEKGRQRAECLAETLRDAGIQAIFTSQVDRTKQTAEPLAKRLKIEPQVVDALDTSALVKRVRGVKSGNILIVGHSNTVGEIIEKLGARKIPPMSDDEYDQLFIIAPFEKSQAVTLHYCLAPSK